MEIYILVEDLTLHGWCEQMDHACCICIRHLILVHGWSEVIRKIPEIEDRKEMSLDVGRLMVEKYCWSDL